MAEQEREKRKKAQEEAQYLIRYTPELQQLLQKDTYETWKEEFTSFIRSFIRIHILNREAFDKALKYVKDRTEDAIRDNERIPKFRMGRYEKNFQFIEGLE